MMFLQKKEGTGENSEPKKNEKKPKKPVVLPKLN
jgi:hypothetical protein